MQQQPKKTVVLGASDNPSRYSYLALQRLSRAGHPVVAIGNRLGVVNDIPIQKDTPPVENVDTVTLYLNPSRQAAYYDYIVSLSPKRIIFNPGTENADLVVIAEKNGIQTMEACTLVLLSTGQY